jgi:hypothetical protein
MSRPCNDQRGDRGCYDYLFHFPLTSSHRTTVRARTNQLVGKAKQTGLR